MNRMMSMMTGFLFFIFLKVDIVFITAVKKIHVKKKVLLGQVS